MKKILIYIALVTASFLTGLLFFSLQPSGKSTNPSLSVKNSEAMYAPVAIPDTITFATERVPLEFFDVYESLDREMLVNSYWHSQTLLFMKRANRFFPVIDSILRKNGVPLDFKYLAVAESGLTNAISPAEAVGFWQFLKSTGIEYGLEINREVDERYHLEKSTEAACRYLKKAYEKYGSWTLAAASYNAGKGRIVELLDRQKGDNYYDLIFGEETGRYVFRMIAFKLIMENPAKYGFRVEPEDLYKPIPFHTVTVNGPIEDFAEFAKQNNTNYKILKYLNPWLRERFLHNKTGKKYTIKLPEKDARIMYSTEK